MTATEREQAHNQIRNAYYGASDNLYALMGIADTLEDPSLRELCEKFDTNLFIHLNREHPQWD